VAVVSLITDHWLLSPEGAIAQLGERLLCKQEVVGSIPSGSTRLLVGCRRVSVQASKSNSSAAREAAVILTS
jgi:hypothetical protein